MTVFLNEPEIETVLAMHDQARSGSIGYWQIYKWLADELESKGVSRTDPTVMWLRGATEANANRGAFATMIRKYTATQYQLRYGTAPSDLQMQAASNAVAENLIKDLVGEALPWPLDQVPDINRIAKADASAVGKVLFNVDPNDTAAENSQNSAWAGALMFSLLGSDQTARLVSTGASPTAMDTLNDLRDVLYAAESYSVAFAAARSTGLLEGESQFDIDSSIFGNTAWSYINGSGSLNGLLKILGGGTASTAVTTIQSFGVNLTLDMILGAYQGKALTGQTTDANFASQARSFFGALTPAQLQILSVSLLPSDAAGLAARAKVDVNARVALGALSDISVQAPSEVAQRFSLYDPTTGQGEITDAWINDRALLLSGIVTASQREQTDSVVAGNLPFGQRLQTSYVTSDGTTHSLLFQTSRGDSSLNPVSYLRFGGDSADFLVGGDHDDRFYGGADADQINAGDGKDYIEGDAGADSLYGEKGDDTILGGADGDWIEGGEGNDLLEGGKDDDTYHFAKGSGSDIIEDSDGKGEIEVEGIGTLNGEDAKKRADGSWQTDDKKVTYTLVATDDSHNDLHITFGDRADVITIKNWSDDNKLGITLDGTVATPVTTGTFTGDIAKATSGTNYLTTANGYQSNGVAGGAADVINGTSDADHIVGLGGNDGLAGGDGDDFIEGGDGDDLILGGVGADTLDGGAGDDYIFGSAVGFVSRPTSTDFTPPVADGAELARGFSWVVFTPPGGDSSGNGDFEVVGANIFPGIPASDGGSHIENTGNVIDGGAGNDHIASGTGADIVHGGKDNDIIEGMDGADILFGDAGDDKLWGDGSQDKTSGEFTPLDVHGNDILSGGDGDDLLVGQGGDDTLYGGTGEDVLDGDSSDLTSTPASIHGSDYLDGGDDDDTLTGGGRDDTLFGGAGNDHLWGDAGAVDSSSKSYLQPQDQGDDYLDGEDGDDYLQGEGGDDTLFGGAGADNLQGDAVQDQLPGSAQGKDYLDGEDGNDLLRGGGNEDTLFGGSGDDQLEGDDLVGNLDASFHGNDYLDGEDGNDTLVGQGGSDTLYGGGGDDALEGDSTDVPSALQGNDYLDGGDGNDLLLGEGGNDTLVGGDGNDTLKGGDGNDTLDGGAGNNILAGGAGDDTYNVDLSAGTTNIVDTEGQDKVVITGASGANIGQGAGDMQSLIIQSGAGAVRLEGALIGQGAQTIVLDGIQESIQQILAAVTTSLTVDATSYSGGAVTLLGGGGDDVLLGGAAGDQFQAGAGDDQLVGLGGADTYAFALGDGTDTLVDTGGTDSMSFGQGLRLEDLRAVAVAGSNDLRLEFAGGDSVTIAAGQLGVIENFSFADGNELSFAQLMQAVANPGQLDLAGTSANDALHGGGGTDTLRGYEGDDVLQGGAGNDLLDGGGGDDVYTLDEGDGQDQIVDSEGAGNLIRFGNGIALGSLSATVEVDANGNDQLVIHYGSQGDSVHVAGGTGAAIAQLQFSDGSSISFQDWLSQARASAQGSDGNNRIFGTGDDDLLDGMGGNDLMDGGAGNDTLLGGAGTDSLIGGAGDDLLDGGAGNDVLQGGDGDDTYLLDTGSGHDIAIDSSAVAHVRLGAAVDPGQVLLIRAGQDLLVSVDGPGGASLTVRDFFASDATWTMTSAQGTSFDMRDLYTQQANARAEGSDEAQALFAQEAFAGSLVATQQNPGNWLPSVGPFVLDANGDLVATSHPSSNPYETDVDHIVSATQTLTSDDAFISFSSPWGMSETTSVTGQVSTTTTQTVTDTVDLPPRVVRTLSVQEFAAMFSGRPYDPALYLPIMGSAGGINGVVVGYVQMAPGGTQQVTRQVTVATTQDVTTVDLTLNQTIGQVVAGGSDNDISIAGLALVDAGAGNDTIRAGGDVDFGAFDEEDANPWPQGPGSFLYGNAGDDLIQGGWADDELVGGLGNDSMDGGAGNDTYRVFAGSDGWDTVLDAGAPSVEVRGFEGGVSDDQLATLYAQLGKQGQLFLNRDVAVALQAGSQGHSAYLTYGPYLGDYFDAVGGNAAAMPLANDFAALEPLYASGLLNTDTIVFDGGIQSSDLHFSYGTHTADGVQRNTLDISWGADSGMHVVLPNADDPIGFGVERFTFADGSPTLTMSQMLVLANAQAGPVPSGDGSANAHTVVFDAGIGRVNLHFAFGTETTDGVQRQTLDIDWGTDRSVHVALPNADDPVDFGVTQFAFLDGEPTLTTTQMIGLANAQLHPAPVIGTGGDDYMIGSDYGADALVGGAGNDTLVGGGGDDVLDAGTGYQQLLDGGAGNDTLIVDLSTDQGYRYDTVVDNSGSNTLRLKGVKAGDVHFTMADFDGKLQMQIATYDLTRGINVSDSGQAIQSFVFDDVTLTLAQVMDRMLFQVLHGGDGNDRIFGANQNDLLYGGGGNDTLTGGAGDDNLDGEAGHDTYVFAPGSGADIVADSDGSAEFVFHGITPDQLSVGLLYGDLLLSVDGTSDSVRVLGWFDGPGSDYSVRFDDGTVWSKGMVEANLPVSQVTPTTVGTPGNDVLSGGAGDDLYDGQGGRDTVSDDGGIDEIDFSSGSFQGSLAVQRNGDDVVLSNYEGSTVDVLGGATAQGLIEKASFADGAYIEFSLEGDTLVETDFDSDATLRQVVHMGTDGSQYGTQYDGDQTTAFTDDGSSHRHAETRDSSGTLVSTDDTVYDSQGNSHEEWRAVDGSYENYDQFADGGSRGDWYDAPIGRLGSDVVTIDDGITEHYRYTQPGEEEAYDSYTYADGSSATSDTLTQADGSFVKQQTNRDGSFANETFDAATGEDSGTSRQPGDDYTKAWDDRPMAGGADEYDEVLTHDDGSIFASNKLTRADGSSSNTWTSSDGSHGVDFVGATTGQGDTFAWGAGDGTSTLQTFGGIDSLQLGGGIASDDLWLRQDGSNLEISIMGTMDKLDIMGWFNSAQNQVQSITLADGESLVHSDVQKLVDAMATFAAPGSSQLEYTAPERAIIAPVIAANWH